MSKQMGGPVLMLGDGKLKVTFASAVCWLWPRSGRFFFLLVLFYLLISFRKLHCFVSKLSVLVAKAMLICGIFQFYCCSEPEIQWAVHIHSSTSSRPVDFNFPQLLEPSLCQVDFNLPRLWAASLRPDDFNLGYLWDQCSCSTGFNLPQVWIMKFASGLFQFTALWKITFASRTFQFTMETGNWKGRV